MTKKCFLKTGGYQISFDVKNAQSSKEHIDVVVELTLERHLGDVVMKSVPTLIALSDIYRLMEYFEEHVARLRRDPDSESYTFVPMDLGFQVQALAGEVRAENDGAFSLRFFVNVGKSAEEGHRVYVGGESVVTLKNIRRFISSLHEALAALSDADRVRLS